MRRRPFLYRRGGLTVAMLQEAIDVVGDCWLWRGHIERGGYARTTTADGRREGVHRAVYELLVGPIPSGMHLDHLCHNADSTCPGGVCNHRRCVNPAHLEPVTQTENQHRVALRRTHCINGHPFDDANTHTRSDGRSRTCRTCDRLHRRRYRVLARGGVS